MSAAAYPLIGQTWRFDLGFAQIDHQPHAQSLHYCILTGPHRAGESETVPARYHAVTAGQWVASWQEGDGTTVVSLEDPEAGTFQAWITLPDRRFEHVRGSMYRVA